jgi:hypothetical protein
MAFLKKYVDKYTFMLISGVWTAVSVYIPSHFAWQADSVALLVTVGNLVIAWLALETTQNHKKATA